MHCIESEESDLGGFCVTFKQAPILLQYSEGCCALQVYGAVALKDLTKMDLRASALSSIMLAIVALAPRSVDWSRAIKVRVS